MPKLHPSRKTAGPSAHAPLDLRQLTAVADLFATLSVPSRLSILQVLQNGPASVSRVIEQTGFKQANVSKQLGILCGVGIVDRQREGNSAIYSIALPIVFELCDLVCTGMAEQAAVYAAELRRSSPPFRRQGGL